VGSHRPQHRWQRHPASGECVHARDGPRQRPVNPSPAGGHAPIDKIPSKPVGCYRDTDGDENATAARGSGRRYRGTRERIDADSTGDLCYYCGLGSETDNRHEREHAGSDASDDRVQHGSSGDERSRVGSMDRSQLCGALTPASRRDKRATPRECNGIDSAAKAIPERTDRRRKV